MLTCASRTSCIQLTMTVVRAWRGHANNTATLQHRVATPRARFMRCWNLSATQRNVNTSGRPHKANGHVGTAPQVSWLTRSTARAAQPLQPPLAGTGSNCGSDSNFSRNLHTPRPTSQERCNCMSESGGRASHGYAMVTRWLRDMFVNKSENTVFYACFALPPLENGYAMVTRWLRDG